MASAPTSPRDLLDAGLAALRLDADPDQRDRLIRFITLLNRWNQAYNLTAVRDPLAMVPRHLLDSLALMPYLQGAPLLDLGTGPGLPGIPLAILNPRSRFVLLDSNGKKIRFVRQAILELGLSQVVVIQARMESYRPAEKFVTIVSRAVAELEALRRAAWPLLALRGTLLIMKGRQPDAELKALATPNPIIHRLAVPLLDAERHLIEIRRD